MATGICLSSRNAVVLARNSAADAKHYAIWPETFGNQPQTSILVWEIAKQIGGFVEACRGFLCRLG